MADYVPKNKTGWVDASISRAEMEAHRKRKCEARLLAVLKEHGGKWYAGEIKNHMWVGSFSEEEVKEACDRLGVERKVKTCYRGKWVWVWSLPSSE